MTGIEMLVACVFIIINSIHFYRIGANKAQTAYLQGWADCSNRFAEAFAVEIELERQNTENSD